MPIADTPNAHTLRELLVELKNGFTLHKPILIALETAVACSPATTGC